MGIVGLLAVARMGGQAVPQEIPLPSTLRAVSVSPVVAPSAVPEEARLFRDAFDAEDTLNSLHARYFEYDDAKGSFVWSAKEGYGGSGTMQCRFEKGQVTAGSLKLVFGKNPFGKGPRQQETFREIYWRVYVRHEAGWEGDPAKLARATCMAGGDWSQGFIAHVWGGGDNALCIDPATGIRDSRKVTDRYNDFAHLRWLGLRKTQTPLFSPAESARWVCIECHVRLNTPEKADGVFELWIDGRKEAARSDLDWHGAWNDYAINAVFLENYWNQGAVKREARWFDNFEVSRQPIGPIVTTITPTLTRTAGRIASWQAQASSDPDGQDIVWASKPVAGDRLTLTLDAANGAFSGSLSASFHLEKGKTYWIRLREQKSAGNWSAWSRWHGDFRTASP